MHGEDRYVQDREEQDGFEFGVWNFLQLLRGAGVGLKDVVLSLHVRVARQYFPPPSLLFVLFGARGVVFVFLLSSF